MTETRRVWILLRNVDFEGDTVEEVFSSEKRGLADLMEEATGLANALPPAPNSDGAYCVPMPNTGQTLFLIPYEVTDA